MGTRRVSGQGDYAPDERHLALLGDDYRPGEKRLVIFFSGAAGDEERFLAEDYAPLSIALAEAGYPIISAEFGGGYQWGNGLAQERIGQLWRFGIRELGARSDGLLGIGVSKGATALLNYASSFPGDVAAVAALIPAVDVTEIHDADEEMGVEIEAAYGGRDGYAAAIETHDPVRRAEEFRALRLRCWYSDDDPSVPPATVKGFAARAGAETESIGAVGHSLDGMDPASLVRFFNTTP